MAEAVGTKELLVAKVERERVMVVVVVACSFVAEGTWECERRVACLENQEGDMDGARVSTACA